MAAYWGCGQEQGILHRCEPAVRKCSCAELSTGLELFNKKGFEHIKKVFRLSWFVLQRRPQAGQELRNCIGCSVG